MGKGRLVIGMVLKLEKKKKNLCVVTTSSSVKQNVEKEQRRRAGGIWENWMHKEKRRVKERESTEKKFN